MKLNGKENYIMLVSMGRHNIIFLAQEKKGQRDRRHGTQWVLVW